MTSIEFLKEEIARRQREIETLTAALGILQGHPHAEPSQKLLPPPPAAREAKGSMGVYTVNGHDLRLGAKAFAVLEAINEAEDCCPLETLLPIFDGNKLYVQQTVSVLNKKLREAGAEIVHFKGEGYRLQMITEAASE